MSIKLFKILGFLIGLFLIISILSYYILNKKIEKFTDPSSSYKIDTCSLSSENILTGEDITTLTSIVYNTNTNSDLSLLPSIDNKFMSISTFYNNLNIGESKWYDDNIDMSSINNTLINNGLYFYIKGFSSGSSNSTITLLDGVNKLGAKIANVNKIQLEGSNAMYYANDSNKNNFKLSSFTVIYIIKFNDFNHSNNILFEMIGNTIPVLNSSTNNYNYLPSRININFEKNTDNITFNVKLTICDSIYTSSSLTNIPIDNIKNRDYNIISLMYDIDNITFIINTDRTVIKTKNKEIILSSMPIIINKDGNINMGLYNFIYYKKKLTDSEYLNFKLYIEQFVYGMYYKDLELQVLQSKVSQCNSSNILSPSKYFEAKINDNKLPILNNDLKHIDKCTYDKCSINDISKLDIYDDKEDHNEYHENEKENKEDIIDTEIIINNDENKNIFSKIFNYIGF